MDAYFVFGDIAQVFARDVAVSGRRDEPDFAVFYLGLLVCKLGRFFLLRSDGVLAGKFGVSLHHGEIIEPRELTLVLREIRLFLGFLLVEDILKPRIHGRTLLLALGPLGRKSGL